MSQVIKSFEGYNVPMPSGRRLAAHLPPDAEVVVVAVEGAVYDWAAYADARHLGADHARWHGAKLLKEDAVVLFPVLNPERYRR